MRLTGVVRGLHADRGFCFLGNIDDGRHSDLFCHANEFQPADWSQVSLGALVEFEEGTDRRSGRLCAVRARLLNSEPAAPPKGYLAGGSA